MSRLLWLVLILAAVVSGCAPDVFKSRIRYPSKDYITSVGSGNTDARARSGAVYDIADKFRNWVLKDAFDKVSSKLYSSGAEVSAHGLEMRVKRSAMIPLSGARVTETTEKDGVRYALAVLDKEEVKRKWLEEVKSLDSMIVERLKALEAEPSRFMRFHAANKLFSVWLAREVLVSRLRYVGFGEDIPADYDINFLVAQINELKSSLSVSVDIRGEHAGQLSDSVSGTLIQVGFRLVEPGAGADVLITGTLDVEHSSTERFEREFVRARASVAIKDPHTGQVVFKGFKASKAGHITYSNALDRVLNSLVPAVTADVANYFKGAVNMY